MMIPLLETSREDQAELTGKLGQTLEAPRHHRDKALPLGTG